MNEQKRCYKKKTQTDCELKMEERTLREQIIQPLHPYPTHPPSGDIANGRGWVPTVQKTLEVTWRKAALIKLTLGLRRMIVGNNAQNTPRHPHPPPILQAHSHTKSTLPPPILQHRQSSTSHHLHFIFSSSTLFIFLSFLHVVHLSFSSTLYAAESLQIWSRTHRINP